MTDKIIALVDGSTYSKSVCDHAAWASARTGAAVELLHVLGRRDQPDNADLSGAIALGARTALLEQLAAVDEQRAKLLKQRGRAILDDATEILKGDGVADVRAMLRHGDLLEAVALQEADAAMIVIGKRGEAADAAALHLGSNVERIARASHKPVLVASRAFKPISKLLIAWDGGLSSMRSIDHVARTRTYAGLEVHVVTVGQSSAETENGLAMARAMLASAGFDAHTSVIGGQPEKALARMVTDANFGIVVMGAYGHSRIRSLVIGSTTTEMIRSCRVPIVLVR
ncbi:nucleotide-binding universal stress UspA family protein [Hoeflea marina]|uniref:Nucleotide-binding universal stress UspA family protein n=1 Tax=Hoeflea marina TaxID=274592 RepID=A0A317PP23_9HYPH|nr:universal stress protein [Hoeflea marina]PWW02001.1 nucleotide-binding universal stress UspA family protein [Hoeflea marina]